MSTTKPGVLYVDDEKNSLKYFEQALKDKFPVFTATNATDGFHLLYEIGDKIGVVIADQRMPREDGFQLLNKFRVFQPDIVRILVTAYDKPSEISEAEKSGKIFKVIRKPWDLNKLETTIEKALEYHKKQEEERRKSPDPLSIVLNRDILESWMELPFKVAKRKFADVFEEEYIKRMLKRCQGNVSEAARQSKINRRTIQRINKRTFQR